MRTLSELKQQVYQSKGARDLIQKRLSQTETGLITKQARLKTLEQVQVLIQTVAKETQDQLRYHIEDIVNTALTAVFPGKYDFVVHFEIKRGKTEADMYLLDGTEKLDPMESNGGGIVDIVSFALRLSAYTLSKSDNLIVLDEPFKFLSEGLKPLAGEILKTLSQKLNLQLIIVTHDEEIMDIADRVFEVEQVHGKSKILQQEG